MAPFIVPKAYSRVSYLCTNKKL